jgi:hypothetical protein
VAVELIDGHADVIAAREKSSLWRVATVWQQWQRSAFVRVR